MFSLLLLAAASLETVSNRLNHWWIIGGDRSHAVFVERSSVKGPLSARRVDAMNVLPQAVGIKAQSMTYEFDCGAKLVTTIRLDGLDIDGRDLGPIPGARIRNQPIHSGTVGDYIAQFACGELTGQQPKIGYATLVPPFIAADHFFRLLGIGLDPDFSAGLAGIDAESAPKTFENLLNALVPTEKHLMVRAIMTPNAAVPD